MLSVFQIYCYSINGFSIVCNSVLLMLSSHKSIEAIQELRYFLSNISVAGVVFSLCLLLIQPQMVSRGSMVIRIAHGPANMLSEMAVQLLASLAVTSYMYGMMSFPLFFIYRSMILANSTVYGQYFNKKNLLATFFVIFLFCCVEGGFLYYSNISYEELFDRLNRTSSGLSQWDDTPRMTSSPLDHPSAPSLATTTPYSNNNNNKDINNHSLSYATEDVIVRRFPLFGDDFSRNPLILLFHGISVSSHIVSYIVILVSAHFMLNTLKLKQSSMSRDTFLANEVLVHAVFAEAFLPLLLAAPVAANAILTAIYENSLDWQEFLPMYCISLVPLLSPLVSILFIGPYRKTIVSTLTLRVFQKDTPIPKTNEADLDVEAIEAVMQLS